MGREHSSLDDASVTKELDELSEILQRHRLNLKGCLMDVNVTQSECKSVWRLTDLLGRTMGEIVQEADGFYISPEGEALKTMLLVKRGPHRSLDHALAEIEMRTRGLCRRSTSDSEDGPS